MRGAASAFWRRLDRPGHDSAMIERSGDGWTLTGVAAFSEHGTTGLRYQVELGRDFSSRSARIEGFHDGVPFSHDFRRAGLKVGAEADILAAWFYIGETCLVRLPQHYRRVSEDCFQYESPRAS